MAPYKPLCLCKSHPTALGSAILYLGAEEQMVKSIAVGEICIIQLPCVSCHHQRLHQSHCPNGCNYGLDCSEHCHPVTLLRNETGRKEYTNNMFCLSNILAKPFDLATLSVSIVHDSGNDYLV